MKTAILLTVLLATPAALLAQNGKVKFDATDDEKPKPELLILLVDSANRPVTSHPVAVTIKSGGRPSMKKSDAKGRIRLSLGGDSTVTISPETEHFVSPPSFTLRVSGRQTMKLTRNARGRGVDGWRIKSTAPVLSQSQGRPRLAASRANIDNVRRFKRN